MSSTADIAARHRAWVAPLLTVTFILLAVAGLGWYGLNSLTRGLCDSTEILRVTSPDGRHDAVLFEHNCGATTDFATHVSVLPAGTELGTDGGNAFAAGASASGARSAWGGPPVELAWQSDESLMIWHDASAAAFFTANSVGSVNIHSSPAP